MFGARASAAHLSIYDNIQTICYDTHILQEAMSMKAGSAVVAGHRVGHVAHLGGALAGVILVYLLSRLPGVPKR